MRLPTVISLLIFIFCIIGCKPKASVKAGLASLTPAMTEEQIVAALATNRVKIVSRHHDPGKLIKGDVALGTELHYEYWMQVRSGDSFDWSYGIILLNTNKVLIGWRYYQMD